MDSKTNYQLEQENTQAEYYNVTLIPDGNVY